MTREQAIEEVKNYDNYPNGISKECRDYIVRVLDQEPCEDAISRQEVINYIDKVKSELTADGRRMIRRSTLKKYISDDLPPVTPVRKKGRWKKEYWGCMYDTCSECGQRVTTGYFEFNYCPNCGVEMQTKENDK